MPRFSLTESEMNFLGFALFAEARARGLSDSAALAAAANTTMAELRALVINQLTARQAANTAALAEADASNAARKAALIAENTAIDSALTKL